MRQPFITSSLILLVLLCLHDVAAMADTSFIFQGEVRDNGLPANGAHDLEFSLWDSMAAGNQIGGVLSFDNVSLADGRFSAELDFGADAFDNDARWLEIVVEGVTLSPRQPITRAPYAIQTRGIFVDENHNVGIGTDAPDSSVKMHVIGPIMSDGLDGGSFLARNPNNPIAGVSLNWLNDVARIRISGEGPGASGGFDIQRTGNNSLMRILHGGNVGIGTTTPAAPLEVVRSFQAETGQVIVRNASGEPTYGWMGAGSNYMIIGANNVEQGGGIAFQVGLGAASTEQMRITNTGKLGIGTTEPTATLHAVRDDGAPGAAVYGEIAETAFPATQYAGYFINPNSNVGGGSQFGVYAQIAHNSGAAICGESIATGGGTAGVEGVVITSGSLAASGVEGRAESQTGQAVGVRGQSFSSSGYDFFASGSGINYGSPSSIRWKNNIEPVADPLDKLAQIRGVYFDWNEEHGGQRDIGFIGEEVGKVLPEVVAYEEDGEYVTGMDYSKLTPLLVEAVNALHEQNHSRIAQLERDSESLRVQKDVEISELRNQVQQLQQLVEKLVSAQREDSE